MRNKTARIGGATVMILLAASAALACGFNFPWQMLAAREQTMRDLPLDSFAYAAEHLVRRTPPLLPPARTFDAGQSTTDVATEEKRLLDAAALAQVAIMRAQPTAAEALARGTGLPAVVRDYVAGAVAFAHRDFAGAVAPFRAALATAAHPPVAPQAVWAAYMLGRSLAALNDMGGAAQAFRRTRALVSGGIADPMELGLASLGEEARLSLQDSGLRVRDPGTTPARDMPSDLPTGPRLAALEATITLYARQAAYGQGWGVDSLQLVAEALIRDRRWLAAAVTRELPRSLVVAYALASADNGPPDDLDNLQDFKTSAFITNMPAATAADSVLDRIAAALDAVPAPEDDDAGRLAALAYVRGRYDLADRFAAGALDPLAAWVRAKLALQGYDLTVAAAAFDTAVRTLDNYEEGGAWDGMSERVATRLRTEPGVLAVGRGDFVLAMRVFYAAGPAYWGDVAYLAERVLTTGELRRFVAANAANVPVLPKLVRSALMTDDPYAAVTDPVPDEPFDRARVLRDMFARRLMREGRFGEAAATFTYTELKREAAAYDKALRRSRTAFWRIDRARFAWDAALIARRDGMELSGTATAPDEELIGGMFDDNGFGPFTEPSGEFTTTTERQRYDETRPRPDLRYHYRYVAIQHAVLAASELPFRSQAYAAVMCRASAWAFQNDDPIEAAGFYRDYLAHGAVVPFATDFGYHCPDPDFAAAARLRWARPLRQAAGPLDRHWRAAGALAIVVLGGFLSVLGLRRRQRADTA